MRLSLFIPAVISIVCWYYVLNARAREEHFKPAKDFYRLSKENEGLFDGLGIAVPLIGALFFTIIFVALLVMQLVK